MEKTMNEIYQIKLDEALFSPDVMDIVETWHAELNEDSIITYRTKKGSRKRYEKSEGKVPFKEMKGFFKELYEFVRTADGCAELIDDCSRKLTIVYYGDHKEIIEGCVFRDDEQMLSLIYSFIEDHGIKDNWLD